MINTNKIIRNILSDKVSRNTKSKEIVDKKNKFVASIGGMNAWREISPLLKNKLMKQWKNEVETRREKEGSYKGEFQYNKEYNKEYTRRPEVKKRLKAYLQIPEIKEREKKRLKVKYQKTKYVKSIGGKDAWNNLPEDQRKQLTNLWKQEVGL